MAGKSAKQKKKQLGNRRKLLCWNSKRDKTFFKPEELELKSEEKEVSEKEFKLVRVRTVIQTMSQKSFR